MTNIAPEIPETLSPYWLRLYGHWVHLEGIQPENDMSPGRAFSDLVTVDGYRYVQRAPRGPRTWSFSYELATAAATAALESAAYDYNFSDPAQRTLFLNTNDARVNMVPPDLITRWANPAATSGPEVYNVGEPDGQPIWLPAYDGGPNPTAGISINIPVRQGITYTATVWTRLAGGQAALMLTGVHAQTALGQNGATLANPYQATITFTAASDGIETIKPTLGFTAGLMFYEGNCPPTAYRAGRRMPCAVSVQDPSMTINPIFPNRNCDPCSLPRETSTFVLQEVAMDAVTPLDIGVS